MEAVIWHAARHSSVHDGHRHWINMVSSLLWCISATSQHCGCGQRYDVSTAFCYETASARGITLQLYWQPLPKISWWEIQLAHTGDRLPSGNLVRTVIQENPGTRNPILIIKVHWQIAAWTGVVSFYFYTHFFCSEVKCRAKMIKYSSLQYYHWHFTYME